MKTIIISIILILTHSLIARDINSEFTPEEIEEFEKMEKMEKLEKAQNKKNLNHDKTDKHDEYEPRFDPNKNLRENKNLGINASLGSSAVFGLTIDYFITQYVSVEISLLSGYMPIALGIKTYFTPKDNWSIYLGLHITIGAYLPLGIEYMSKNGFKISFEAGPAYILDIRNALGDPDDPSESKRDFSTHFILIPWGGIKLGYYF